MVRRQIARLGKAKLLLSILLRLARCYPRCGKQISKRIQRKLPIQRNSAPAEQRFAKSPLCQKIAVLPGLDPVLRLQRNVPDIVTLRFCVAQVLQAVPRGLSHKIQEIKRLVHFGEIVVIHNRFIPLEHDFHFAAYRLLLRIRRFPAG